MPRKPTGRGRGRPKGSGHLGEEGVDHVRLTVRIPRGLYDALEAVAEREHYTREAPELARTVRTALEHYLACPHNSQTGIVPQAKEYNRGQTENVPEPVGVDSGQTAIESEPATSNTWQPENVLAPLEPVGEQVSAFPSSDLPAHILRIAHFAADHPNLSLAQLSQALFHEGVYRASDRKTGEQKPVNRGTLQKWLEQARTARVSA